jgi:AraC-like DNA-binding protein
MRPVIQILGESFVYACASDKAYTYEQFVPEHLLAYQISGETHIYHQKGEMVIEKGQFLLGGRNQFAKTIKVPGKDESYKCVSVILSIERLRKYAADNDMMCEDKYQGVKNMILEPSSFLNGYFLSVQPYIEQPHRATQKMIALKVNEGIELILQLRPDLKSFLFDFHEPYKIDLEEFMLKNFHFNAPIEHFAKLSGRSLTNYKRDFAVRFNTSPAKWLKNKRLSEAYYLIKQKNQKAADIYLDLGFENLSHFYSAFKEKFGHTPAQAGYSGIPSWAD